MDVRRENTDLGCRLVEALTAIYKNGDWKDADLTIMVRGKYFLAHKLVFSMYTKHFESPKGISFNAIHYLPPDVEPEIFELLLQYLYTGSVDLRADQDEKFLQLGHLLNIKDLVCDKKFEGNSRHPKNKSTPELSVEVKKLLAQNGKSKTMEHYVDKRRSRKVDHSSTNTRRSESDGAKLPIPSSESVGPSGDNNLHSPRIELNEQRPSKQISISATSSTASASKASTNPSNSNSSNPMKGSETMRPVVSNVDKKNNQASIEPLIKRPIIVSNPSVGSSSKVLKQNTVISNNNAAPAKQTLLLIFNQSNNKTQFQKTSAKPSAPPQTKPNPVEKTAISSDLSLNTTKKTNEKPFIPPIIPFKIPKLEIDSDDEVDNFIQSNRKK